MKVLRGVKALAYRPDRVLLMFGANDVKESRLLKFQTEFEVAMGGGGGGGENSGFRV